MPELGEDMYCSQQICIPPTYPYLLRQFAKAAIRTQPSDLLKWSTAYFRCLSLNIPPPVKPRLEYPFPRDYHGITPGWLRALLHQLHNNETVSFKVLWDRWIGACLQHHTLIQILVLGGFTDNQAIPWLRFVAMCAAHLTENLTQTMILICEILTEEPEGGSAMIPLRVFLDLYQFLAKIEASYPQTLRNYYFLDKFLELYQEKIARDEGPKEIKEEAVEETTSYVSSESSEELVEKKRVDDGSVVSCPSVPSQDPDNFMRLMEKMDQEMEEEGEPEVGIEQSSSDLQLPEDSESQEETEAATEPEKQDLELELGGEDSIRPPEEVYLARLGADQTEPAEELIEHAAVIGYGPGARKFELGMMGEGEEQLYGEDREGEEGMGGFISPPLEEKEKAAPYEEVFVEAIPGIGGIVPDEMVDAVCLHMEKVGRLQHEMVMPRNIRHYECPPLHPFIDHVEYKI